MEQKLKYHEKLKVLAKAMEETQGGIIGLLSGRELKEATSLGRNQLQLLANILRDVRLRVQPQRQLISPEEKARKRLLVIHAKHLSKTLTWLRTDGIKKGAQGQRRKDGAKVVFTSDPIITYDGIRIGVHFTDIDKHEDNVDPMQFMPDVSAPPKPTVANRATVTFPPKKHAAARKSAPATKNAAAK